MDSISSMLRNVQMSIDNFIATNTTMVAVILFALILTVIITLAMLRNKSTFTASVPMGMYTHPGGTHNVATENALSEIQTGLEYKYMGYGK